MALLSSCTTDNNLMVPTVLVEITPQEFTERNVSLSLDVSDVFEGQVIIDTLIVSEFEIDVVGDVYFLNDRGDYAVKKVLQRW